MCCGRGARAAVLGLSLLFAGITAFTGLSVHRTMASHSSSSSTRRTASLPDKLIVGYTNWNQCDESVLTAARAGVNVIVWFSINLSLDTHSGQPVITNGPDWTCVARTAAILAAEGLPTTHLISIGGWNSPHPALPPGPNAVEAVYAAWNHWNRAIAAQPHLNFPGFDGLDWDLEGNDDPLSPYNEFTVECLDFIGRFSQLAQRDGYIVSMAPAESYLDPSRPFFDRSLRHEYDEWRDLAPGFAYHGLNAYAYLLSRYGRADDGLSETFAFVTIQLYEGYSHAQYKAIVLRQSVPDVLVDAVQALINGWIIDYSHDDALKYPVKTLVNVPPQRLVVGLANGWAGDGKFFLAFPDEVREAYHRLMQQSHAPRGFAFWNILDEGKASPLRPGQEVWMARGLNDFLHTRPPPTDVDSSLTDL